MDAAHTHTPPTPAGTLPPTCHGGAFRCATTTRLFSLFARTSDGWTHHTTPTLAGIYAPPPHYLFIRLQHPPPLPPPHAAAFALFSLPYAPARHLAYNARALRRHTFPHALPLRALRAPPHIHVIAGYYRLALFAHLLPPLLSSPSSLPLSPISLFERSNLSSTRIHACLLPRTPEPPPAAYTTNTALIALYKPTAVRDVVLIRIVPVAGLPLHLSILLALRNDALACDIMATLYRVDNASVVPSPRRCRTCCSRFLDVG